jgi:hypothetical protein
MGKKYLDIKKGSLEESILDIWQIAAEEVGTKMDGRTKGYKSHRSKLESRKVKREEKKKLFAKEAYEIGTDEYREYLERLTPGETIKEGTKEEYQKFFNAAMKKFKIDSPADLKSDEEKKKFFDYVDKNYTGEKDEELTQLAREFKISSMREAMAKVWGFSEGELPPALKKAIDDKKKGKEEKDEDKEVIGNKTLTGKKAAVVEIDPEPDLENRKKKKSGNPSH